MEFFDQHTSHKIEGSDKTVFVETVGAKSAERDQLTCKTKKARNAKATELMQLLRLQECRCALTGIELTPETARLDHVIPKSKGGTDAIDNLQWLHVDANTAKATMAQEQFISMCRKVVAYQG
jgi:5-methylcytosine-specific restriction endonuclease McrA